MIGRLRLIYLGTVFLTGASVLIVEVAAVRMLAPYFGTSLYVLSSVLTMILLALSLGYYVGGKLSDRLPYHVPLYSIITVAGLTLLLLVLFGQLTMPTIGPIAPLMFGPLIFSLIFFFLPAFLMGIDSPYVIKLLSEHVPIDKRGEVVGATFFWSTAGSITGSLASGFALIPLLGLTESLVLTGVILVAIGIGGGYLIHKINRRYNLPIVNPNSKLFVPAVVVIIMAVVVSYISLQRSSVPYALYERDGYYSNILVFEGLYAGEPARFLKRDINNSSAIFLNRSDLVYGYTRYIKLFDELLPETPERFLMLGGGAYTMPKYILNNSPETMVDVVELEPSLLELSKTFFELPDTDRLSNHIMDARPYLARTDQKYDLVYVDTFSTGHFVPPHLVTIEFFESLKKTMTEEGVLMINFIGNRQSGFDRVVP
jgi:predicted membrane-bound spermidine synthase